jgi:hypothetical protein
MPERASTRVRQIPTHTRLIRAFQRNYIRQGYLYSGCIRYERLRDRFGSAVQSLIDDLIQDGILQRRSCGALAYELVPSERSSLRERYALSDEWEQQELTFHPKQVDLLDLGSLATHEARCAANHGMSIEVYRLQSRLRQLPLVPGTDELRKERERVVQALIQAARRSQCVPRINPMAGTLPDDSVSG